VGSQGRNVAYSVCMSECIHWTVLLSLIRAAP
jgi:hypothetical protein